MVQLITFVRDSLITLSLWIPYVAEGIIQRLWELVGVYALGHQTRLTYFIQSLPHSLIIIHRCFPTSKVRLSCASYAQRKRCTQVRLQVTYLLSGLLVLSDISLPISYTVYFNEVLVKSMRETLGEWIWINALCTMQTSVLNWEGVIWDHHNLPSRGHRLWVHLGILGPEPRYYSLKWLSYAHLKIKITVRTSNIQFEFERRIVSYKPHSTRNQCIFLRTQISPIT